MKVQNVSPDAVAIPINEAADHRLHVGATKMAELIATGELRTFKIASRRFVTEAEIQRYIRARLAEAAKKPVDNVAKERAKKAAAASVASRQRTKQKSASA